ncbi:MAG: hypothetical protein FJY20_04135 [Bacteroidetes bacterium]|nr:hypothetical protein [Bacteroidota bacterium]
MKKIANFVCLIFFLHSARAQFPVHPDSIYVFIKQNSVWRKTVRSWQPYDSLYQSQIKAAKTEEDTVRCFVSVLEKLNDVHSYFIYKNKYYNHFVPVDSFSLAQMQPLLNRSKQEKGRFAVQILKKEFLYIQVPGISAADSVAINFAAQNLYDSIAQFASRKIRGIIVDLRLNAGGNLYPMLAGLSPILGNSVVGYEVDPDSVVARKWKIENGNITMNGQKLTALRQPFNPAFERTPVVVLTGPITASSGSMTAIAFKHRPGTAFFGEATTHGYTTSNGQFRFAPDFIFHFATHFVADRKMNFYQFNVPVDILMEKPDNFDDLMKDEKILTIIKWLENH